MQHIHLKETHANGLIDQSKDQSSNKTNLIDKSRVSENEYKESTYVHQPLTVINEEGSMLLKDQNTDTRHILQTFFDAVKGDDTKPFYIQLIPEKGK